MTTAPGGVPYSSYSVDKKKKPSPGGAAGEKPPVLPIPLIVEPQPREDPGIVTVLSGGEAAIGVGAGGLADPELAALQNLPVFAPILRGTLAGNILGRVRSETARGMDATGMLLLCRDMQEHIKLCGGIAADAQAALTDRIKEVDAVSARGFFALQAHAEEVRSLVQALGDVDAVARDIEIARQRATYAQQVLERLDAALVSVESEIITSGPTMVLIPEHSVGEEVPELS